MQVVCQNVDVFVDTDAASLHESLLVSIMFVLKSMGCIDAR